MTAVILTTKRIGWKMKGPFTVMDQNGVRINFSDTSPSMVKSRALEAWQQTTEQILQDKWWAHPKRAVRWNNDDPFLVIGGAAEKAVPSAVVLQQVLKDRSLSELEKGALAAVACDAVWTRERLFQAGLAEDSRCEFCGLVDSMHHRAWVCPHSEEVRRARATPQQIRRAQEAGPSALLWTRGWLPRPALMDFPPLDLEMRSWVCGEAVSELQSLEDVGHVMGEWIFVDGSCSTHADPQLRRAGWSVVEVAPYLVNGGLVKLRAVWGTLPAGWPQTPQAAEHAAIVAAAALAKPSARCFSDCKGAIALMCAPAVDALRPQRRWGGAWRLAMQVGHPEFLRSIEKVKAHTAECTGEALPVRLRRLANDWADELAKEAVSLHRHQASMVRQAAARIWKDAEVAARVLAAAIILWPAARPMISNTGRPTTRKQLADRVQARQARIAEARRRKKLVQCSAMATHSWMHVGSVKRCCWCMCQHPCLQPCPGIPVVLRSWEECAVQHAHTPRRALLHFHGRAESQEVLPAIVCVCCGAWSTSATQSSRSLLLKPCRRAPSRAGQDVLSRVRRGMHPKAGGVPPALLLL